MTLARFAALRPPGWGRPPTVLVAAVLVWVALVLVLLQAGAPRALSLLVVAPALEEAAFRAGLHEALLVRWRTRGLANLVTALAFAAVHVAAHGQLQAALVVLPALLVGAVYERTRQVRWCVLLHAAMNAAWLVAHGTP